MLESTTRQSTLTEDDELMLRIQDGETAAFEQLVDRYRSALVGFFFRDVRDIQLAEDLAQETLLRVYNKAWDYLPRGRFRGWMYRIARNLMIDSIRRQSHDALVKAFRGRSEDDEEDLLARVAADLVSPAEQAGQSELARIVDAELQLLPTEQRLTFVLHHFNGLTLSEVADVMETSVPTSKSRLRLSREKLSAQLLRRGVANPHDEQE